MAKKFNIFDQKQPDKVSKFFPEPAGLRKQPKVVIANAAFNYGKKLFYKIGFERIDEPNGSSKLLNTPVYADLVLKGGSYTDEKGETITYGELKIELALIEVNNEKNIVTTTLQGRNGTVKEYISDGDFQVSIKGKIFGDGANAYPFAEVQALVDICLAPQAIEVESDFLKIFEVSSLVIRSYVFPQTEATRNYQEFTLNCLSDKELILLKDA